MANNTSDPLTDADLVNIKESLKKLDQANEVMDRATIAGIDVKAFITRSREARDQLLKIKTGFFPGK